MTAGERITVTVERPAAGGRMIARHEGAVLLVAGAIPGEIVDVEIDKVQRGMAWAHTLSVVQPSPDRIDALGDWACGGNVLAHIAYPRQITIKRDIIRDAFRRIGRLDSPPEFAVAESPVDGYRMRARLHVAGGRIGFFREGTHDLCDPASTRQLLPATMAVLGALQSALAQSEAPVIEVEVAENCSGDQRALHLIVGERSDPSRLGALPTLPDVTGVSCGSTGRPLVVAGVPEVADTLRLLDDGREYEASVTRQAHAFFQGNRYLLAPLVNAVVQEIPEGRVLDLYAGVGLFSVALAARGRNDVIAIEGDRVSAQDLKANAARAGGAIEPRHQSVEAFLGARRVPPIDTIIVDPPRTGMTRDALRHAMALRAPRVVYVSCDVATLARDARTLADAGYQLQRMQAFDLFPNTAHVETLAIFLRDGRGAAGEQ